MVTIISHSPADTAALGKQWGLEWMSHCKSRSANQTGLVTSNATGWLIGLCGELGAGKTQLVRGLAEGLGCRDRVHSPTFVLLHEYRGGHLPLYHLDLYRLKDRREILNAGLEEYLKPRGALVVVEWIEKWLESSSEELFQCGESWRGGPLRLVNFSILDETRRELIYADFGA